MRLVIAIIAAVGLVLCVGCPTENKAKPAPAKQEVTKEPAAAPSVEADFEAEADEQINKENYEDELNRLEKAIGGR